MLDVDSVRAFLAIAEHESFTKAARLLATTQGALSVKLRRLEDKLGVRLIERTPRMVRLSAKGLDFLPSARAFVEAHEVAMARLSSETSRFALGITHILVGHDLPHLLARVREAKPNLTLEVQVDTSPNLIALLDRGMLDGVIGCTYADRRGGQYVGKEPVRWYAAKSFQHRRGDPLPIAVLARTCHTRDACIASLEGGDIPYSEAFVGGGTMAVVAAVVAGLGAAALPVCSAPPGCEDVGERLGLPPQPSIDVTLHTRRPEQSSSQMLRTILEVLRGRMPEIPTSEAGPNFTAPSSLNGQGAPLAYPKPGDDVIRSRPR